MTVKNESVMGIGNFITQFTEDLKSGKATGWWGERYSRKGDRISFTFKDTHLETVYDLVEYIKSNKDDISEEELDTLLNHVNRVSVFLSYKRVYFWEVDASSESSDSVKVTGNEPEEPQENELEAEDTGEDQSEGEVTEDKLEKNPPDWEKAKELSPDKNALFEYAQEFDIKLDKRKGFTTMLKQFQGKWNKKK